MKTPRVGIGYDCHRLEPGGPLRLGGINVPYERNAVAHSDGDALLHAVIDAILGGAALGDIGQMFPDTNPDNEGRDSAEMLVAAIESITAVGLQVGNIDCVVHLQRPRLLPHRQAMRERIADIIGIEAEQVGLKSKTGESLGPVGEERMIEAQCVAMLLPIDEEE